MTPAFRPTVSLAATPTELPVAWDVIPLGGDQQEPERATNYLLLFPGKPGEILLRTRNNGEHPIQLRLEVKGNFPPGWMSDPRWQPVYGGESANGNTPATPTNAPSRWTLPLETLAPRTGLSETISFQVPTDFFEHPQALTLNPQLMLECQGHLYLYGALPHHAGDRLVGYQVLDLYVRPPATYLNFLPEIYQQSDFLGRFLTIFEQAFAPTMDTMDAFWAYLDPLTAPKALLPFLAEWVAWPLTETLTLKQQRRLIRHAAEIYQWRGTRRGLQLALSLVTGLPQHDRHIEITEDHQTDFVLGQVTLGDRPALGGGKAFHFSVVLRPESAAEADHLQDQEAMIRAIIDQEKPAFCTYDLAIASDS